MINYKLYIIIDKKAEKQTDIKTDKQQQLYISTPQPLLRPFMENFLCADGLLAILVSPFAGKRMKTS